jgi:hypothetical protein
MNTTNLLGPMPVDAKAFAEGLNKVVAAGSAYPLGFSGKGLVMRLRMCATDECHDDEWLSALMNQVADEIERLERENAELRRDKARLRAALDRIVALGARMPEDSEEVCIAKAALSPAIPDSKP